MVDQKYFKGGGEQKYIKYNGINNNLENFREARLLLEGANLS